MQFSKHYTLDEARALLPRIREWLDDLQTRRARLDKLDARIAPILARGDDAGGAAVNEMAITLAGAQEILQNFRDLQIQIKDLERGLIDFPSLRDEREIFLCWEKDEEDIEFWHDLESGYSGRERL